MQRNILALALGASVIGAAALAACSGGGGSSSSSVVSTPANAPGSSGTGNTLGTARLTLTINRTPSARRAQSTRRGARGARKPAYVSTRAAGLQVAVSAPGATTRTVYADISSGSVLCTPNGNIYTCAITIPTVASNETIAAVEVDQLPTGDTVGYGTGFPTGSNILAANTVTPTNLLLGGNISITLPLGPVAAGNDWFDCTNSSFISGPANPPPTTANFGFDGGASVTPGRIVVTAGVASEGVILPEFEDAAGGFFDYDTTPAPFVDVNGSHTPITITASNSAITFAPMVNNGTPPPNSAFVPTASIPDDSYEWLNCIFVIPVQVAANITATSATVTLNNNLTAKNPFLNPPASYAGPFVYNLAALTASAVTGSPAVTGGQTATVTGTDFMATSGMMAESVVGAGDSACKSGGGATLATMAGAAISNTTWQQVFTITPVAAGTCTFVLSDSNTDIPTLPIHVTVGP